MEKKQTFMMYGIIAGIVMIIVNLGIYIAGLSFVKGMQYVTQIPFLICIILSAIAYSKANDGFVTFGNVFGSGFKLTLVVTVLMLVWAIISIYAFPEMKDKVIEMTRQEAAKNPNMTDEALDMSTNMIKKFWNVFLIGGSIIGTIFFGSIFSLIGGAVAKKNGEQPMA